MEPTKSPFENGQNVEEAKAYIMENLLLFCSLIFSFFVIPKYATVTIEKILFSFVLFFAMSFLFYIFIYAKQLSIVKYLSFYFNPSFLFYYFLGFLFPIFILVFCFLYPNSPLFLFHFNYYFFLCLFSSKVINKRYKYILNFDKKQ